MNAGNADAAGSEGLKTRRRICVAATSLAALLALGPSPGLGGPTLAAESWYRGNLIPRVYHGRPLLEVIQDLRRYVRRRIVLDPTAAGFQYSGIVKLEDVDAWLRDLPTIYPLEIVDCHTAGFRNEISACADSQLLLIRSRIEIRPSPLRTALLR